MSPDDTKILELNLYQKSDKAPCIVYADLEQKRLMDAKIILKTYPQFFLKTMMKSL